MSEELRNRGVELLGPEDVDAGPIKINFPSQVYTRGMNVEFVERTDQAKDSVVPDDGRSATWPTDVVEYDS